MLSCDAKIIVFNCNFKLFIDLKTNNRYYDLNETKLLPNLTILFMTIVCFVYY